MEISIMDNFDRGLPPDSRGGPNCGITAIAVLTGVPFQDAWQYYNIVSPDPTRKGETLWAYTCKTINELGVNMEAILCPYRYPYQCEDSPRWTKYSVMKFVREVAEKGVTYFVRTSRHVLVVKDGLVIDQGSNRVPIDRYWHKKGHVSKIMKVIA
jgi:hypothetical protein